MRNGALTVLSAASWFSPYRHHMLFHCQLNKHPLFLSLSLWYSLWRERTVTKAHRLDHLSISSLSYPPLILSYPSSSPAFKRCFVLSGDISIFCYFDSNTVYLNVQYAWLYNNITSQAIWWNLKSFSQNQKFLWQVYIKWNHIAIDFGLREPSSHTCNEKLLSTKENL